MTPPVQEARTMLTIYKTTEQGLGVLHEVVRVFVNRDWV
jgi:hypothetical protein